MDLPVQVGELVAGKYAVERVIGDGGMAVVVAAQHLELHERVALKFLLPEMAKNAEACARFVREARAAARIKGEHVARVLDVGTRDDGSPFIVMEYLEGTDLGRLVETGGPLALTDAVRHVLQACEAVAQAHALGIVHRDLKPANLFLTTGPDGSPLVKVLDFGISKWTSVFSRTLSPNLTTVNASVGTPQYMAPEQARDAGNVDVRADVWALGAILYELLAGRPAFNGDDVPAIVMMIATEEPPSLEELRPDLPPQLADTVRRCLRKNRDLRFADVAELARALEPFGPEEARRSVARIARILGHDSLPPPATLDSPPSGSGQRSRWPAVALASSVALAAIGGLAWSKRNDLATGNSSALEITKPSPSPASPPPTSALAQGDVPPKAADREIDVPQTSVPAGAPSAVPARPAFENSRLAGDEVRANPSVEARALPPTPARTSAPAPGPSRDRAFDATSAATELFAAAGRASSCTKADAPSGNGRATITFAPDGSVSRVVLPAPFAHSPNHACLRDAFASARIRPFDGEARTLEQRFRVFAPDEPGTLTFHANVPASVVLDGRSLGKTPQSVTATPGGHTIVFTHPELGEKSHSVTLAPGQEKTVRATFEPARDAQ